MTAHSSVMEIIGKPRRVEKLLSATLQSLEYSKSLRIRTDFFESQAEIGSYFKGTNTKFKVWRFLFDGCIV